MNFNPRKPVEIEVVKSLNGKKYESLIGFLDGKMVGACCSQMSR